MTRRRLRLGAGLLALVLGAPLGYLGWGLASDRRFESERDAARALVAAGHFAEARRRLEALPAPRTRDPEVSYWLGVCAHAAGDFPAAVAAWSRVPASSTFYHPATLAEARTLVGNLGRFADAEAVLEAAARVAGPRAAEVREVLSQVYFDEGRRDAMRRLLRASWRNARDPASDLRDLWMVDQAQTHYESVWARLSEAGRKAPDDDRVWLGLAHLATQAGRFDEAGGLLDRCLARRPDDPAVWRARLGLARAAGDVEAARGTLSHLPAADFTEAELLSLRAWLAARQGDADGERAALERLVRVDPGETRAVERLAVLAVEAGDTDRANDYRRRKAGLDATKDRYRRLVEGSVPRSDYARLAGLTEALGRPTEARGWWSLAARYEPDPQVARDALARLRDTPDRPAEPTPGGTLADLILSPPDRRAVASSTAPPGGQASVVPLFRDDAERAGLRFRYDNGRSPRRQLPETTSGGVGLIDYDGDGWLDVYCVQGGPFPPDPARPRGGDRLLRNKHDGTFEDVSGSSKVADLCRGYGHGVAVGDFDNDGHPDLFLTRWRSYALLRNKGNGTFEDVTERVGLGGDRDWPTSAAFADLDNDGDLDLYVCHYLAWDADRPTLCGADGDETPDPGHVYSYCMPHLFAPLPDHLYRNDGSGRRFVDVTSGAGIVDRTGRGLGVVAADLDEDGKTDLFVANDTTANFLFHNEGGLTFDEVGFNAGVASNADGAFQAGMGTSAGDLDGDGRPDLVVTNFYTESTSLYHNLGRGAFSDRTAAAGLAAPTRFRLGFGIGFLDANNDGRLDLAIANGHVIDNDPALPYKMPAQLLVGDGSGRVADVSGSAGACWSVPRVCRGLAVGDLDNDGRPDVLMVDQAGPLAYFHNVTERPGHFLTLRLIGGPSNRDAVGAVVTVTAGGRRLRAWRTGGGSYQSANDPRIHLGLGPDAAAEEVVVRWPSGRTDRHPGLAADRGYELREGDPAPHPLPGFPATRP